MKRKTKFWKYDGAGNDFILMDGIEDPQLLHISEQEIARLCHRRFGIGADGLMVLSPSEEAEIDFRMKYYNSDGRPAEMCGNGGRCIAVFAYNRGHCGTATRFVADDGEHTAEIATTSMEDVWMVKLGMRDVDGGTIQRCLDGWVLNTGVPHYVQRVSDLEHFDVVGEGRKIRHREELGEEGANVNFIEDGEDGRLTVRTYERGVEDETWACGTGVTACAIVTGNRRLKAKGGDFAVDFDTDGKRYYNIKLIGPAAYNFSGEIDIDL